MRKRTNPFTGELEDYPPPETYLCPSTGARPDQDSVSAALGFRVPRPFAELAGWIHDQANGDPYECAVVFGERVGIAATDASHRYDSTPCELFPFGSISVDGDHHGYLVHAPELTMEDYPICHYCPMDSDGVIIEGVGTYDGIASIISFWAKSDVLPKGKAWADAMRKVRSKEETNLSMEKAVNIPKDWKFQASSDGVGVLAPESLFDSRVTHSIDQRAPVKTYLKAALTSVRMGYPATALYYLREGYWFNWTNRPRTLCELLCDVYDQLERSCLAQVVDERLRTWSKTL